MTKEIEKFKWGKLEVIDLILSTLVMAALPIISRLLYAYNIL